MSRKWKSDSIVNYTFNTDTLTSHRTKANTKSTWKIVMGVIVGSAFLFMLMYAMGDRAVEECLQEFQKHDCLNQGQRDQCKALSSCLLSKSSSEGSIFSDLWMILGPLIGIIVRNLGIIKEIRNYWRAKML